MSGGAEVPSTNEGQILIITGMQRSGTSLLASILQRMGVHIGDRLLDADLQNAKGFFENVDFVKFREIVLATRGDGQTLHDDHIPSEYEQMARRIVQENSARQPWGWKDPFTSLFLPFWAALLPAAKFIFIYRSPWEVVNSLHHMGALFLQQPADYPLQLWAHYNRKIIEFYDRHPQRCLIIQVDALIHSVRHDQEFLTRSIRDKFGILLGTCPQDVYDESLFNKRERHHALLVRAGFPDTFDLLCQLDARATWPDNYERQAYPEPPAGSVSERDIQTWLEMDGIRLKLKRYLRLMPFLKRPWLVRPVRKLLRRYLTLTRR